MQKISLKNIIVGAFLAVAMCFPLESYAASQTFTSNGTFTVPAGVTQIFVTAAAGGGGGGMGAGSTGGGGGSGDAILNKAFTVVPGNSYAITVGVGGAGGIGGQPNAAGDGKPGTATSMTGLFTLSGGTADLVWTNPWVMNRGCGLAGGPGGSNGVLCQFLSYSYPGGVNGCQPNPYYTQALGYKSGSGGGNIAGGVGGVGGGTNCPYGGCGAANTGQPGGNGINGGGGGSGGYTSTSHPASGGKGGNGFVQIVYPDTIPTVTFWADSPSISAGTSTNLHWSAPDAASCTASGAWSGTLPASGIQSTGILSGTQVYFLTCSNAIGTSPLYTVPVIVIPITPVVDLKVNSSDGPVTLAAGAAKNLSWTATNATSCTASGVDAFTGSKSVPNGSETLTVARTSTDVLTCTGPGGTVSDSVQINATCTPSTGAWGACDCSTETKTRTNINASCLPWTESDACTIDEKNSCRDFNWKEVAP